MAPSPSDAVRPTGTKVLVTGATGYLGGRLVLQLLAAGHNVRCMVRQPAGLAELPWHEQVQVVQADALETESLDTALDGVETAYYLIHSMDGGELFAARDRQAAENFRRAAVRLSTSGGWPTSIGRAVSC